MKNTNNTKGYLDDVNDEDKRLLDYIGGGEPQSELAKSLEQEVQNVKSNEDWRREHMTLLMRDKENRAVGKCETLVSIIRKINDENIDTIIGVLGVDKDYVLYVKNVIEEHPELDDEEIAEIIVD